MGTNYYGHIIPTHSRRKELVDAIENNRFYDIQDLYNEMYSPIEYDSIGKKFVGGIVHLGKDSYGWQFLWNPNIWRYSEGKIVNNRFVFTNTDCAAKLYDISKEGVKAFIYRDDIEIYDEYRKPISKDEFWNLATKQQGMISTQDNVYRTEYSDFLERLGYKLEYSKTCFIVDGLRFAAFREFS